ncbi:MAG: hypothetical protein ABH860_05815 [bacterium]
MKRLLWFFVFILCIVSVSFSEGKDFIDKEVIEISNNGKISRENPFRALNFKVVKDKIYVQGKILRDTVIYKKGETFEWDVPYVILAKGHTMQMYSSLWNRMLGKTEKQQQQVVCAVRMTGGIQTVPETLILGETFYLMSRPGLMGLDYITVFRGETEK